MKLTIFVNCMKLSTEINNKISIKDLIQQVKDKNQLSQGSQFIVMNSQTNIIYKNEDIIENNANSLELYFLPDSKYKKTQKETKQTQTPIEELIMKVTGASKKLVIPKRKPSPQSKTTNINLNEERLNTLLALFEGSSSFSARSNGHPQNVIVNERLVQQLVEMGFLESSAREALRRANNNLNDAMDILAINN